MPLEARASSARVASVPRARGDGGFDPRRVEDERVLVWIDRERGGTHAETASQVAMTVCRHDHLVTGSNADAAEDERKRVTPLPTAFAGVTAWARSPHPCAKSDSRQ
jgi:hypothetical protein